MEKSIESYTAKDIEVLDDLEAVRRRPGMFIGNVGVKGLHQLLWEVVNNSVDEHMAGFCKKIKVVLHKDGSVSVEDDGRGIPVDVHPILKRPALEIVMTKLHSGGKFNRKVYKVSGGLHGVGLSIVCALSKEIEVWVKRDGNVYYQKFSNGKPESELKIVGKAEGTGTKIKFKPNYDMFEVKEFKYDIVYSKLKELAYINRGLEITLEDERNEKRKVFLFKDGILGLVKELNRKRKVLHDPIYIENSKNGVIVEIAVQFIDAELENVLAFANSINTTEGGTHVTGFKAGLTRAINEFGKKNWKKFEILSGMDVREGLTAVLSVKLPEPQFEGQTKTKLTNSEVRSIVESITYSGILEWFEKNQKEAENLIERFIKIKKAREAAKRTKELIKKREPTLPGKLADCSSKDLSEREIFIVEGESAGGSAKQARDRRFQAVLPIKGKILNVEKAGMMKILKNEEIKSIVAAIGAGIGKDFDLNKVRYKKIIIMTDADVDGAHIRTLLLTFFYRYMRPIVEAGYLYIAQPPLYRIKKQNKIFYAYSEDEMEKILKKLGEAEVQRYKGLGEMNPEQLWETTMDPRKRVLIKVTVEDAKKADELFSILMGENVESRREFIIAHSKEVRDLDV
ncbi:MAG: DNA topoisomerase (ATP-hydrolyzing) subunit B [Archaeoglobaceae archaeon]|nr:DNA topoisomerase (ATP-hydrolyzing) subunit B [Archaeoglobaceae archaeon]MCX8152395.1 DNA topoisomerase (ATP-hydrolyzing) subunit B [Archaeoglobaceae archaeon]MDW8013735.1 DNA topoisomerase (ATP-hydrolyzing) subunit B [Archaeoglobaceae archaeon]